MSKFCSNCGNEVADEAVICPKCGVSVSQNTAVSNNNNGTSNGMATAGFILSFFVPLLGLIFSILGLKKVKETNINDANVRIHFNFIRTTCVIHISKRSPKFRILSYHKTFP